MGDFLWQQFILCLEGAFVFNSAANLREGSFLFLAPLHMAWANCASRRLSYGTRVFCRLSCTAYRALHNAVGGIV